MADPLDSLGSGADVLITGLAAFVGAGVLSDLTTLSATPHVLGIASLALFVTGAVLCGSDCNRTRRSVFGCAAKRFVRLLVRP